MPLGAAAQPTSHLMQQHKSPIFTPKYTYIAKMYLPEAISNAFIGVIENATLLFGLSLILTLYFLHTGNRRRIVISLILTLLFISVPTYFFISGQIIPPTHDLRLRVYGLQDTNNSTDIYSLELTLNFYSSPTLGSLLFSFKLNEAVENSTIILSVPSIFRDIECKSLSHGGPCEVKQLNENTTWLYLSNNSVLKNDDYEAYMGFKLDDNVTPKLFISLFFSGKDIRDDAPSINILFNPREYSIDNEFAVSNLNRWPNEQQEYTQVGLNRFKTGEKGNYIWTHINVRDRLQEALALLTLSLISGLIVALILELGREFIGTEREDIVTVEKKEEPIKTVKKSSDEDILSIILLHILYLLFRKRKP